MKWMIDVCETYSFPQLALLDQDDGMLERLLDEGWEHVNSSTGKSEPIVPSFVSIAGPRRALLATSAVARLGKNSRGKTSAVVENLLPVVVGAGLGALCTLGVLRWMQR